MRLLILFPKHFWEHKMSPGRRDVARMLCRLTPSLVSGPGWSEWSDAAPLQANIDKLLPDAEAIIWYKPLGNERDGVAPIVEPRKRSIPAVEIFNEAYWEHRRAFAECQVVGTDLVIHHHLADAHQFDGMPAVHIPHCANQRIYTAHARHWNARDIPLLVVGALSDDIYPLRTRVAALIKAGRLRGAKIHSHPGYRLPDVQACDDQQIEYAQNLGRSRFVLCCSSKYNYGLAKTVEAAMSGACVIGDIAPDFARTIGPHMFPLDSQWSSDQIEHAITAAMASERACILASNGQSAAVEHHNIEAYCYRLIAAIQGYIARGRAAA